MNVLQDEVKPVPVEVLAESIRAIAEGVRKLRAGPLNDRCLVMLIQHAAPSISTTRAAPRSVSAKEVRAVLDGIDSLEREYLKPKKAKS